MLDVYDWLDAGRKGTKLLGSAGVFGKNGTIKSRPSDVKGRDT